MKKDLSNILFLIAGVLFLISAFVGKNYTHIPLGICFFVLGITINQKDK